MLYEPILVAPLAANPDVLVFRCVATLSALYLLGACIADLFPAIS